MIYSYDTLLLKVFRTESNQIEMGLDFFFVVLATKKAKTVIKSNRSELLCCYCSVDDFEDFNFCCYYILPPIPFYVTQNMPLSFLEQPLLYNLLLL